MDLRTAIKKVRVKRTFAAVFVVFASLFVLTGALKAAYAILASDTTAMSRISLGLASLIWQIYDHTRVIEWVWRWAPMPDSRKLNSAGNFGFVFCLCIGFIGSYLWGSASSLQNEIAKALERAQRKRWERELDGETAERPRVAQVNIFINPVSEDAWYQKPLGMILIGVAIGTLGQWTNLMLGLVKL